MAIVNGYSTAQELKDYLKVESFEVVDDAVIDDLITASSRLIDTYCGRTFYLRAETRYFDIPGAAGDVEETDNRKGGGGRRVLYLDDDLLTVGTLTNGDGTVIASSSYNLYPANVSPKYAIGLKRSSSVAWEVDSNGEAERVISVSGSWGFCDSGSAADNVAARAAADTKQACLIMAAAEYRRRTGVEVAAATVTGAGVVLTPQGIPRSALDLIAPYRRLVVA